MICYGEPTARISATAQWMRLLPFGAVITARHAAFHGPAATFLHFFRHLQSEPVSELQHPFPR